MCFQSQAHWPSGKCAVEEAARRGGEFVCILVMGEPAVSVEGIGAHPGPPTFGIKWPLYPLPEQPWPPFLARVLCWDLTALLAVGC